MKQKTESAGPVVASGRRVRVRLVLPFASGAGAANSKRRVPVVVTGGSLPIDRGQVLTKRTGETRLFLKLDRRTPPGTYTGTVSTDGRDIPLTVVVPERSAARLSPQTLHLTGEPGSAHCVDVVVENRGNTPIVLPHRSAGFLAPRARLCTALREASRGSGKDDTAQGFLDRFARAVATSINQERALMVAVGAGGDVVISPGETTAVTLNLTIPKRLASGRYRARVPLGRTGIRVFLATSAEEAQQKGGES